MTTLSKIDYANNIFSVAERGDRKIMEAHKHAIIFVGLTRVGKSTAFNWVLKKPMIGKGKLNTYYVPQVAEDSDIAQVGNTFASVTLAPNIYKDYEPGLSMVDMAGYEDTRNYVGVIGVSYFLKALFERVRQVKFVIVFDENKFRQEACAGLIKTFQGFINMFNFAKMTDQIKDKLKKSLSLVVTRAKQPQNHYDYIKQILQKMQDPTFLFDQKSLILQILEEMKDSNRIDAFEAAKDSKPPEPCTMVNKLNARGWEFFNLDENEAIAGQSLISLPFTKDFQRLPEIQKDTFTNELKKKIDGYLDYSLILKKVVENFTNNWSIYLSSYDRGKANEFSNLRFQDLFEEVRNFLANNDFYKSEEFINVELKVNYEPPSFIKSIKSIIRLQEIVGAAGAIQDSQYVQVKSIDPETKQEVYEQQIINLSFKDIMYKFKGHFEEMIKVIKVFASNQEEQQLLERTNFILQRGFREFEKLYDLDASMIHDVKVKLAGNCAAAFELGSLPFKEYFINSLNQNLILKLFPSFATLNQYEEFFTTYSNDKLKSVQFHPQEDQDKVRIFLREHQCTIEMVKADLLVSLLQKEKAAQCYLKAHKNITEITVCVNQSPLYDEQAKALELNKLSMKKRKLIKKIVLVIKSLAAASNSYLKYSLGLSQKYHLIQQTCQIYQSIIDQVSVSEKLTFYKQFSDYCAQWGRFEQARVLLQKKLEIEQDSFENYSSTVSQLAELETNKQSNQTKYGQNLRKLGKISVVDEELDEILDNVEKDVAKLIEQLELQRSLEAKQ